MQQNNVQSTAVSKSKGKIAVETVAIIGVLTALGVICAMPFPYGLTIRIGESLKFSLSFLPIALAARRYGILGAVPVAFLSDFLQAMVSGLGFNPLISFSSSFVGVVFGLFLYKGPFVRTGEIKLRHVIAAVLTKAVVCSLGLTTFALVLSYGMPLLPTLLGRILQTVMMSIIEFIVLYMLMVKTDILKRIKFIK